MPLIDDACDAGPAQKSEKQQHERERDSGVDVSIGVPKTGGQGGGCWLGCVPGMDGRMDAPAGERASLVQ